MGKETKLHRKYIIVMCVTVILMSIYIFVYNEIKNSRNDKMIMESLSDFSLSCGKVETVFDVEKKFVSKMAETDIFNEFLMFYITDEVLKYAPIPDFEKDGHFDDMVSRLKDEELRKMLNSQMFLSRYTKDVAVSRLYDGYTVTRTGNTYIDDFLVEYGLTSDTLEDVFAERSETYGRYEVFSSSKQKGRVLIVGQIDVGINRSAYVFIDFDLIGYLAGINNRDNIMSLTRGQDVIVSNMGIDKYDDNDISKIIKKYGVESGINVDEMIYDHRLGISFFVRQSECFKDYYYVYVIVQTNNIMLTLLLHLFVALMLFALSFKFITWLEKCLYIPINNMKKMFNMNDGVFIKFGYMEEEARSLIETNELLRGFIDEKSIMLKEKFIIDCTKGVINNSHMERYVSQYGLSKYNDKSVVVIFSFEVKPLTEIITSEKWIEIKEDIFRDISRQIGYNGELINNDFFEFMFITNCIDIEKFIKELSGIVINVESKYAVKMFAAISDYFQGFKQLQSAFLQASYVKNTKSFLVCESCASYNDLKYKKNGNGMILYPINVESDLIEATLNNNIEYARALLIRILQDNILQKESNYVDTNEFLFMITSTIKRIMANLSNKEKMIIEENEVIYLELKMCNTKQELADKITSIFERIFESIGMTNKKIGEKKSDEVMAYIDNNFTKDISLASICDEFSLSVSYVSFILKEYKNINFKSYLTKKRIDKAKEIMRDNKHMKIVDLYEMVGYTNQGTFIRQFKQIEGISPGQYQKNL